MTVLSLLEDVLEKNACTRNIRWDMREVAAAYNVSQENTSDA